MIFVRFSTFCLPLAMLLVTACGSEPKAADKPNTDELNAHQAQIEEQFVHANQSLQLKENDDMDAYAKSHNTPFIKTTSGIRYHVYAASLKGDSIKEGDLVHLKYKLFLLDGTLAYSSDADGVKEIEVGHENIESGIHKGLQLLKRGDKALLMIPSALAHGLLGDMNKIPPQMPIVYDLEVW
jgi:FKBP-type peptidyl-prolyl cis-trans isomerase FkpA